MYAEQFQKTTIGADYLKTGQLYSIDTLLDYLSGLKRMKAEIEHNEVWSIRYANEINAVISILKSQTA
ncbi:MAG: hypothetical protein WKF97_15235 [Chitinophagaceae bacterium]